MNEIEEQTRPVWKNTVANIEAIVPSNVLLRGDYVVSTFACGLRLSLIRFAFVRDLLTALLLVVIVKI